MNTPTPRTDVPDMEDYACEYCGAMAGACPSYPRCPNGPEISALRGLVNQERINQRNANAAIIEKAIAEFVALQRDLAEALAIARELARLATCMDALPRGSIGTQVALLEALERRVGVRA